MDKIEEKRKKWAEEIKIFINDNNMQDVFTNENIFYNLYNCNLYVYIRVSTEKQDFGRQLLELYNWAKKHNIKIYIKNIFFDKFTGKKITRDGYQTVREELKKGDYFITTNLNRLGRNWDEIKKEWYNMETNHINRIILDNENLSVELPNEEKQEISLSRKFIQDISFSAVLYSACQKIQEVSETTKDGRKKAAAKGHFPGRPAAKNSKIETFIKILKLQIEDGLTSDEAIKKVKMPRNTYFVWLRKYKNDYKVNTIQEVYNILKAKI